MVTIQMYGKSRFTLEGKLSKENPKTKNIDVSKVEAILVDLSNGYNDINTVMRYFPHLANQYVAHVYYGDTARMILTTCFGDYTVW